MAVVVRCYVSEFEKTKCPKSELKARSLSVLKTLQSLVKQLKGVGNFCTALLFNHAQFRTSIKPSAVHARVYRG